MILEKNVGISEPMVNQSEPFWHFGSPPVNHSESIVKTAVYKALWGWFWFTDGEPIFSSTLAQSQFV